jgi:phage terminase large subunit GpA-like protein
MFLLRWLGFWKCNHCGKVFWVTAPKHIYRFAFHRRVETLCETCNQVLRS